MLIEKLDTSLTSPYKIREQKTRLALDWLLAFRFSSPEFLATRLGSTKHRSWRTLRDLIDLQYVQYFQNVYTYKKRFLMLTPTGAEFLRVQYKRDISSAVTQGYRLNRYSKILHDLAVQNVALKRLEYYTELIWDRDIILPEEFQRPDLLMLNLKHFWIAYEYERTRKEQKRVYISFYNHYEAILNKHYQGAYFFFDLATDMAYYQKLFAAEEWPLFVHNRKTGIITEKQTIFKPDSIQHLRNCFRFYHEKA